MKENKCHITSIGGQAVIEGVMMRGPKESAIAVRKPDGEIIVEKKPVNSFVQKYKINKIPIVRGVFSFIESLISGTKALMFSAEFYDIEDEEDKKKKEEMTEEELDKYNKKNEKMMSFAIFTSVIVALVFGVGVFMLLPSVLVEFLGINSNILRTLLEGVVRIAIFLVYILLVSKMPDIRRVFEYHGAEHKTIFCYEAGEELTVENVKKQKRLHPRCGTSFLILVMIISIIIFSFITYDGAVQRVLMRLLLLPLVAGISYEFIKFAGRHSGAIIDIINAPGMWLQKITTREPDDSQIEVAIESLKAVLTGDKNDDKW